MLWHLIAAIFAGLGCAGIALLLRKLSGQRLPRWIIPAFAGLGILGYQVYQEYHWFEHKQQQLPPETQLISTEQRSMIWRPWTFLFPITNAFTVVDNASHSETGSSDIVTFQLYHFERAYPDRVSHHPSLLNCTTRELVPLDKENGQPMVKDMRRLAEDSALYQYQCANQ
ncbi:hypothetical protein [Halomonas halocynthiae]|uniref:hypothetical protein n=1 Tax=Halomonas halocynthiae TaxID=176290 RepID=UPI000423F1DB|nr:hypothetical protein [Halomonas halocynthiae]